MLRDFRVSIGVVIVIISFSTTQLFLLVSYTSSANKQFLILVQVGGVNDIAKGNTVITLL